MLIRVGCAFTWTAQALTPAVMVVAARQDYAHRILEEDRIVAPPSAVHEYSDLYGNRVWRVTAGAGHTRVVYDALVETAPDADPVHRGAPQTAVQDLPDDTLIFTLPSRHCQSDLLGSTAWELFGAANPGWDRVQAICDWLHLNIDYRTGSQPSTSAVDAFQARAGVCRDFAHLGVVFCRALNIPARYVCGYLPDIGIEPPDVPMDFHAWFEAYVDGQWRTFDARHNQPRIGRVALARGRDAVDVAFLTTFGTIDLKSMEVWSDEVDSDGFVLSGLNAGSKLVARRLVEVEQ